MELLYSLLILLFATRLCGEIAERMQQPALVGELLAGVLLGAAMTPFAAHVPILADLSEDEVFTALTDLAMFFLMLLAGLEMRPRDLTTSGRTAIPVALGGMLLPLALGLGLGFLFLPDSEWKLGQSLFIGVALAVTAVPVTIKVLMDLDKHRSTLGRIIISASLFDDVFSLLLLAILTAVAKTGTIPSWQALTLLLSKVLLFFCVTYLIGRYLLPLSGRWVKHLKLNAVDFSLLVMWGLLLAVFAEYMQMHFIVGAFAAGLFFNKHTIDRHTYDLLHDRVKALTFGFLAPVFFASIGLHLNVGAMIEIPFFLSSLLIAAIVGKLAGAGLAAYACGLKAKESFAIGMGMNARGAVELIIADIVLRSGLLAYPQPLPKTVEYLFSAVVIIAIVTTLLSPLVLRRLFKGTSA